MRLPRPRPSLRRTRLSRRWLGAGFGFLKAVVHDFLSDHVLTLAAALAFYTSLSLAPLLLVLLWLLSFLGPGAEEYLIFQSGQLIGEDARRLVGSILERADEGGVTFRGWAGSLSLALLVVAASGVFAQLQAALNVIWEVEARPGAGLWGWLRKRLLSLGMLGTVAFLLLVSLAASTAVDALQGRLPLEIAPRVFSLGGSILVSTVLFAMVFKFLPDVVIAWRDVWTGAALTAVLFAMGKYAIGAYLARKGFGNTYGAAGSIVAVLAWVYFSSTLVFVGAELTQEWARHRGRALVPDRHAVHVPRRHPDQHDPPP